MLDKQGKQVANNHCPRSLIRAAFRATPTTTMKGRAGHRAKLRQGGMVVSVPQEYLEEARPSNDNASCSTNGRDPRVYHSERPPSYRKSSPTITSNANASRTGNEGQPLGTSEAFRNPPDLATPTDHAKRMELGGRGSHLRAGLLAWAASAL